MKNVSYQSCCGQFPSCRCPSVGDHARMGAREYMMYHHDKNNHGAELHPEMYDENGNVFQIH